MNKIFTISMFLMTHILPNCLAQYTGGIGKGDAVSFASSSLNGTPVGINSVELQNEINPINIDIHPNPNHGIFEVTISNHAQEPYVWWLQDISNRVSIPLQQGKQSRFTINCDLAPGIYFLHLICDNKRIIRKVVIR